ncbi:MAG: hypothetical protein D6746_07455 [Bacteroidetes bacterium]|nr:MAG: hypothetical protein D6746_07455 [Bacteroidota bacterium]
MSTPTLHKHLDAILDEWDEDRFVPSDQIFFTAPEWRPFRATLNVVVIGPAVKAIVDVVLPWLGCGSGLTCDHADCSHTERYTREFDVDDPDDDEALEELAFEILEWAEDTVRELKLTMLDEQQAVAESLVEQLLADPPAIGEGDDADNFQLSWTVDPPAEPGGMPTLIVASNLDYSIFYEGPINARPEDEDDDEDEDA